MATEEKIVYSVEVEGADKVTAELQRLGDVLKWQDDEDFIHNLARSYEWLGPAIDKATKEGVKFGEELKTVIAKVREHTEAAKGLAETLKRVDDSRKEYNKTSEKTAKNTAIEVNSIEELKAVMGTTGKETKKTGGTFDFANSKLMKFAGALGVGVYSMYSLASALRRGFRAAVEFVKGGIELAVKAHSNWREVIGKTEEGLKELQKELGEKLLPAIGAVNIAQQELMATLGDEQSLDAAAQGIGGLAVAWAGVVSVINQVLEKGKQALADAESWAERHPGWAKYGRIAARVGVAAGTFGTSELLRPGVKTVMAAGRAEEEKARAAAAGATGWVGSRRQYLWKTAMAGWGAEEEEPARGGGAAAVPGYDMSEYRTSRARLAGFAKLRGLEDYRAKSTAEAFGGTPEELAAKSSEIIKSLTETKNKIEADAAKEVAKNAEVKGAYVKMWGETLSGAARSGDVKGAFKEIAIDMGAKIAISIAAASVASSIAEGGFGMWFKKFLFAQDTAHIPGGAPAGGIPAVVHPGEYILKEAQLGALQMGLGIAGGKGKFAYEVPPAAPGVDVHIYPGADVEVKTALRARAGELRLAQLEA